MNKKGESRPDLPEDIPSAGDYHGTVYQRIRQVMEIRRGHARPTYLKGGER